MVNSKSEEPIAPLRVGEIWVSGGSVAQGYFGRAEETECAFHAKLSAFPARTFLRTGDIGFLAEGQLFITGRAKDLIIIRGRNIYPQDIELTVERAHPAIRPGCSAAFSVEENGEERLVIVSEFERRHRPDPRAKAQDVPDLSDRRGGERRQADPEVQAFAGLELATEEGRKALRHSGRAPPMLDPVEAMAKARLNVAVEHDLVLHHCSHQSGHDSENVEREDPTARMQGGVSLANSLVVVTSDTIERAADPGPA